jgi:hypothetical protein
MEIMANMNKLNITLPADLSEFLRSEGVLERFTDNLFDYEFLPEDRTLWITKTRWYLDEDPDTPKQQVQRWMDISSRWYLYICDMDNARAVC